MVAHEEIAAMTAPMRALSGPVGNANQMADGVRDATLS
jgi:hypothetical protein